MNTITVGQIRQNPTEMFDAVEAGETYVVTRHGRQIAQVIPLRYVEVPEIIPARKKGQPSNLASKPRLSNRTSEEIDALIAWVKGND